MGRHDEKKQKIFAGGIEIMICTFAFSATMNDASVIAKASAIIPYATSD